MAQVNGKNYYVGGTDDGRGNITLNYVDPRLHKMIGFNAINYSADTAQVPGVPVEVGTTVPTSINSFSMPIEEWNAIYKIPLAPYSKDEVFPKVETPEYGASILDVGRVQRQGITIVFGDKPFDIEDLGDDSFRISVLGNEPQLESAVQSLNQIILNTDVLFRNLRGEAPNEKITSVLGIPKGADFQTQGTAVINAFNSLRINLKTEYSNMIENNNPDIAILKEAANITDTDPNIVAAKLADYQMGLLQSPFDLVNAIERFNLGQEDKQIKANQNISNVLSTVFPSAVLTDDMTVPAEDANTQFINFLKENITAEGLELVKGGNQQEVQESNLFENLNEAIIELSQGDENIRAVLNQEAFRIINAVARGDEGAPFKIEDLRSRDIDVQTKEFETATTSQELLTKWLTENSVDTDSDDIKAGATVTINGKKLTAESDIGGEGSFFDPNTGYLIFKNPSLPPGHVDPRPTEALTGFFGIGSNKSQENWDILYGKTHRPDGTPLKPYK